MENRLISRDFYLQNTIKIAQQLLGCFLVREFQGKLLCGMITETEAYRGQYDLACHASKGLTPRTKVMFGPPGHAYIYLVYGMYQMLNVVTEKEGFPAAVLVRSIEVSIEDSMDASMNSAKVQKHTDGPGKLTKFLHIDQNLNGWDLTRGEKLWIERPAKKEKFKITRSPRIGVDYARHCQKWKWNYKKAD